MTKCRFKKLFRIGITGSNYIFLLVIAAVMSYIVFSWMDEKATPLNIPSPIERFATDHK